MSRRNQSTPSGAADVAGDPNTCPDTFVDIADIVSIINNVVFGTPFCQACL